MDMDVCCAYFCTGMSIFGVIGLVSTAPSPFQRGTHSTTPEMLRPPSRAHGLRVPSAQLFMYGVLTSGGEWFLGVPEADAPAAASGCLVAAGIYGLYLVYCGMKLSKPAADSKKLQDEDA